MPADPAVTLDIPYPSGFYAYQTPALLDYVAAVNGIAPPVARGEPFTYLDLGCGDGFTITLLAAAYPQCRFVGVDLNPAHVAAGRALAEEGGLRNVCFVEGAFEGWRGLDLPSCEYLALHGVYAWIGAAARGAVLEIIRERLEPGGLVYAGYNAWPGWAAAAPLRQFFLEFTRGMEGDPVANIAATLRQLKELRAKGAGYFAENPAAARMLDEMAAKDIRYVAHEIYSPDWAPLAFADLARQMAGAGLAFAGSAELANNYARPSVKAAFLPLLLKERDRARAELYRDYANNTFFRRDVFVKPRAGEGARRPPYETLGEAPFGTKVPFGELRRGVALRDGEMPLAEPAHEALRRALANGTRRLSQLASLPPFSGSAKAALRVLELMALGNQIAVFAADTGPVAAPPEDWRVPVPLNRRLLLRPLNSEGYVVAISPALGNGVPIAREEALIIAATAEDGPKEAAAWAWRHATEHRAWLRLKSAPATERRAHEAAFAAIRRAMPERLSKLLELGIIAPRSIPRPSGERVRVRGAAA